MAYAAGLAIRRATLDGWVMRVGELLTPVSAAMRQELLGGGYIQADETAGDARMHDGRERNGRGWLWPSSHPRGPMAFDFRPGCSRDGPRQFLAGFRGIFETDGYADSEQLCGPEIVPAACGARGALWARRKFDEAAKLAPHELLPARIVAGIDKLFALDAEARAQGLDLAGRHGLRQQRAPVVLAEVRRRIEQALQAALPASALAAC